MFTYGAGSTGIDAYSNSGNVTVSAGTTVTHGDYATAVYAYSFNGTANVTANYVETYGNHSTGIYSYGFLGSTVASKRGTGRIHLWELLHGHQCHL